MITRSTWSAAPFCLIRGRILPAAPRSRSFFEAGCIDFLKKVKLGQFLRKIRLPTSAFSRGRHELCLKRDSLSSDQQFKSNLNVKKRFCRRVARLKQLGEGAVFSKMSDFSPFLRNRQSSCCSCDRYCMAHCLNRSFNRIFAHFSVFSLILTRRFSSFLTKNALSVFLCNFMFIFQSVAACTA